MKKLIAAIFLTICLFNIAGQLVLREYLVYLSDRFFNEQASKGLYKIDDLTEVKIPVNMPRMSDWKAYENITGQVQFKDISYNYIKMKITRTAIYLMCIPDYAATRLSQQNIIVAKQVKDHPVPGKNHVPYGKMMVLNKFSYAFLQFEFTPPSISLAKAIVRPVQFADYYSADIPEQPPRGCC